MSFDDLTMSKEPFRSHEKKWKILMTNSGSIWGGKLLFGRCPELQISGLWRLVPHPLAHISLFLDDFPENDYFWQTDSMISINLISTYPANLPNIFSSLGCTWTRKPLTWYFWKWKHYLFLQLYLSGVYIKLMNSFVSLPILDQLSRLSCLTGFHSLD